MIKLIDLYKVYNRGKTNEIKAINHVSLDFDSSGLVAIHGASGSGKTTLLNVIGGLDKVAKGEISLDGNTLRKYRSNKWDNLRNEYVGYIFQNYHLLENMTVYNNVAMALNLVGIYDKKIVEERVNKALDAVGMLRFKKRLAGALSGGQKQRIAIARALVKSPRIIIADEPTGNLDSANTVAIMNIIKKIATKCLVLLVTHEDRLVEFYADRVIEIKDGSVVDDRKVLNASSLDLKDERVIYLKDLHHQEQEIGNVSLDYFYDRDDLKDMKLMFIYRNGTLYIKNESINRIKIIDKNDQDVIIKDESYQELTYEQAIENDFELDPLPAIRRHHRKGVIRFRDCLKNGFVTFYRGKAIKRVFGLAFLIVAMITAFNLASFGASYHIDTDSVYTYDSHIVGIVSTSEAYSPSYNVSKELANEIDSIARLMPTSKKMSFCIRINRSYQTTRSPRIGEAYPIGYNQGKDYPIYNHLGRMMSNRDEVVIDRIIADNILDNSSIADASISSYEELIGMRIDFQGENSLKPSVFSNPKIVGIIDSKTPIMVLDDQLLNLLAVNLNLGTINQYYYDSYGANYVLDKALAPTYSISSGVDIDKPGEVIIHKDYYMDTYAIGDELRLSSKTYTIVGFFESPSITSSNSVIMSSDDVEDLAYASQKAYVSDSVLFYSTDKADTVSRLKSKGYVAYDWAEYELEQAKLERGEEMAQRFALTAVLLAATLIYLYFTTRTSMISRIKEIGIYRCLGAKKFDICKIFIGDALALSIINTLPGYLVMTYVILRVEKAMKGLVTLFYFPIHYFAIGLVGLFVANIIFGLLPVVFLLRKTPAEIVRKYDI